MWESKEQAIDVNYNSDELWFVGVYGQAVAKPTEIRKWEENTKFFKLLDKTYPRIKADRMLKDLSLIALAYSKLAVQQRLTFKPNPIYAQDEYSILAGMGKYIPVQTNRGVTGDV